MGMFDTIKFPKPIACTTCGKLHEDTQTKQFEKTMTIYIVGDMLPTTVIHGIVEETIVCDHDSEKEKCSFDQKVYLVIWHGILIDVASSVEDARKKLDSFGFGDLFLLYQLLYKERNDFQAKYGRLRHWIKSYREFERLPMEEQRRIKSEDRKFMDFAYLNLFPHLNEEDPLLSFLEELDGLDLSDKTMFF
jgi:hypothetical protein